MSYPNPRKKRLTTLSLSCNYATESWQNKPIYLSGDPASKCETGPNSDYPSLCSTDEQYDVNNNN